MSSIIKLIKNKPSARIGFLWFFFWANTLIFLSNLRLLLLILTHAPNMIFYLVHFYYIHDYTLYLSAITQGASGYWLFRNPYTTEPSTRGIFYIFYLLAGKIGGLFQLESPIIYHLARLFSLELFIIFCFVLAKIILGNRLAFWGAFFAIITTISPLILFIRRMNYPYYTPWWWENLESLERLNGLPHNIFGQALLVLVFIFITYYYQKRRLKFILLASLASFIGGIIFPPLLAPIVISPVLAYLFFTLREVIWRRKSNFDLNLGIGLAVVVGFSLASLYTIKIQEQQGFPWNIWTSWNVERWNYQEPNFTSDLFFSLSVAIIFTVPAALKTLGSGSWEQLLILAWIFSSFVLLPLANFLQIPVLRLFQAAPFVPLGISIAQTIFNCVPKVYYSLWKKTFFLLYILFTFPLTFLFLTWRIESLKKIPDHALPKTAYEAIRFIKYNLPKESAIMSEYIGLTIPVYTPTLSYFGHPSLTKDVKNKHENLINFYSQKMPEVSAKKLLLDNNISYVYLGHEEKRFNQGVLTYNFLQPIYQNPDVIIYKLK